MWSYSGDTYTHFAALFSHYFWFLFHFLRERQKNTSALVACCLLPHIHYYRQSNGLADSFKYAIIGLFLIYFRSFQTNFTTNQCEKCQSIIRCWDSNLNINLNANQYLTLLKTLLHFEFIFITLCIFVKILTEAMVDLPRLQNFAYLHLLAA